MINIVKRISKLLFVLIYLCCASPNKTFDAVAQEHDRDRQVEAGLKIFEKGGYGNDIDMGKITPDQMIEKAESYMDTPHCMGGISRKCMDCSGLIYAVFLDFGIRLPHNSEEQARYGTIIPKMDDLKRGDLVFFIRSYKTTKFITHSGIYLGNNQFLHTSSKKGVSVTSLKGNSYWDGKFIFGTRVF